MCRPWCCHHFDVWKAQRSILIFASVYFASVADDEDGAPRFGLASICGRLGVLSATGTGPPPPASQTASQEEVLAFLTALVGDVEVSAEGILMTKPLEALVERLERRVGIGSAEVKADKMDREALLGMFEGMVGRLEKCA